MSKKYILTDNKITFHGNDMYRIKYLIDIPYHDIKAGDLGGWIQSEDNLSHDGQCAVDQYARVWGDVHIYENAYVSGNAWVCGNRWIYGTECMFGDVKIHGGIEISGLTLICGGDWTSSDTYNPNQRDWKYDELPYISGIGCSMNLCDNTKGDEKICVIYDYVHEVYSVDCIIENWGRIASDIASELDIPLDETNVHKMAYNLIATKYNLKLLQI